MTYTEALNLKKPDYDDIVDIQIINDNMDTLDAIVSKNSEKLGELFATVTLPAGSIVGLSPITEEIYNKYNIIVVKCTNNESFDIIINVGMHSVGLARSKNQTFLATLTNAYANEYSYYSYSLLRTTGYTLSASKSTTNDFIFEFYGVAF